jgi:3-hydroxyacyl-[acyl-carrier-protein] dehydratase
VTASLIEAAPATDGIAASVWRAPLSSDQIRSLLPHTWPFIFLDRVTELKPPEKIAGLKNVTVAEPHFAGHFAQQSVMPGALMIETLAQLAGVLLAVGASTDGSGSGRTFLAGVQRMRFRRLVRPGDQLRLKAVRADGSPGLTEFRVEAKVGSEIAVDGLLTIAT